MVKNMAKKAEKTDLNFSTASCGHRKAGQALQLPAEVRCLIGIGIAILIGHYMGQASVWGAPPATGPAVKNAQSLPTADPAVLTKLESIMERALTGRQGTSTIIADLRGTDDARLEPYFLQIARSENPVLKITGLTAANYVSRNPRVINITNFMQIHAPKILTLAIAVIVRNGFLSYEQLVDLAQSAPQPSQRLMAASEAVNRHQGDKVAKILLTLTESSRASVRYFAALKLIDANVSATDTHKAISILNELVHRPELRLNSLKKALIERVGSEKLRVCEPWVEAMSQSADSRFSVKLQAALVLLNLHNYYGVTSWRELVTTHPSTIRKIELGLIAIQYAPQFKPSDIALLGSTQSPLLRGIIDAASLASEHRSFLAPIRKLIEQGQPLFLNWCLDYAGMPNCPYRSTLLRSLIEYSTIADGQTGQDYRRAVAAAIMLVNLKHAGDLTIIKRSLNAFNPGVVAAVLAAMLSPHSKDFANLIAPHWGTYMHRHHRRVRLMAALVMGKFNQPIALTELRHVVLYDPRISDGLRAQAGWYYARMTGTTQQVLKAILAYHPK